LYLDQTTYQNCRVSPEQDKLALKFAQIKAAVVTNRIAVVNLTDMMIDNDIVLPEDYLYCITAFEWTDNDALTIMYGSEYVLTPSPTPEPEPVLTAEQQQTKNYYLNYCVKVQTEGQIIAIPVTDISYVSDFIYAGVDYSQDYSVQVLAFLVGQIETEVICKEDDIYYLLMSCFSGVKNREYILIQYKNQEVQVIDLGMGVLQGYKLSPDNSKAAFTIASIQGDKRLDDLIVIRLAKMSQDTSISVPEPYQYEFKDFTWTDNNTIDVEYNEDTNLVLLDDNDAVSNGQSNDQSIDQSIENDEGTSEATPALSQTSSEYDIPVIRNDRVFEFSIDTNGDNRKESILFYKYYDAGSCIDMYVDGEKKYEYYQENAALMGVETVEALDLDGDKQDELFITLYKATADDGYHYTILCLKQTKDGWVRMSGPKDKYGCSLFDFAITRGESEFDLIISSVDTDWTVLFNASDYYTEDASKLFSEEHHSIDTIQNYRGYHFNEGDSVGYVSGICKAQTGDYNGRPCLIAYEVVSQSHMTFIGMLSVSFTYNAIGECEILNIEFTP